MRCRRAAGAVLCGIALEQFAPHLDTGAQIEPEAAELTLEIGSARGIRGGSHVDRRRMGCNVEALPVESVAGGTLNQMAQVVRLPCQARGGPAGAAADENHQPIPTKSL